MFAELKHLEEWSKTIDFGLKHFFDVIIKRKMVYN
jgi:hypothetical protein